MSQPPNLLNDDGTASMATMLMLSHHAFRRDVARLLRAVTQIQEGDTSRVDAVRDEWKESFSKALHGHHTIEDTKLFPDLKSTHPELVSVIEKLAEQHHAIDPLLERGDAAFAELAHPATAATVLHELKTLLDEHLAFEEAYITPCLRNGKEFPVPTDEATAAMYAEGFAWSMQGIAPEVLEQVQKMLPEILLAKLPVARAAFEDRSKRVWGTYAVGAAVTSVPTGY